MISLSSNSLLLLASNVAKSPRICLRTRLASARLENVKGHRTEILTLAGSSLRLFTYLLVYCISKRLATLYVVTVAGSILGWVI
jgi:hypothetical protein